ncbi:MAG: bifunctional pyr operon transcriptional regulator/uracil phosphoribosyltransferase PyrR [Bacteroidia bacterium]
MPSKIILSPKQFEITINRLCCQLIENHNDFENSVIIGVQPRGVFLSERICLNIRKLLPQATLLNGNLDITFYRDDFKRRDNPIVPSATEIDFIVENKNVILVDDVLYTGRTIRAGLDALLAFGRPNRVELLTLIDRKFSRHVPIEPNYIGKAIDTISSDKVIVKWKETDGEDGVWLNTNEE